MRRIPRWKERRKPGVAHRSRQPRHGGAYEGRRLAVDAKHKMIVEQAVSNDVLDMGLLQCTAGPAPEILEVKKIDVVADNGYFGTVTLSNRARNKSAGMLGSRRSDDVAPRLHRRGPEGSVRFCGGEMALDVESVVSGGVG